MTTKELIKKLFVLDPPNPENPVPPGLYHTLKESRGTYTRFYLRVEPDGRGLLLANATAAAHLSPSGVLIAKGLLDDRSEDQILDSLQRNFSGASRSVMLADLEAVSGLIANLGSPIDNYPIINLEDPAVSPYEIELIAPLHADVPVGDSEKIKMLLDNLWDAAIPHVTMHVQNDFSKLDLVRSVERAEDLGMITGVRGRAVDLNSTSLIEDLAIAGIDHLNIPLASSDAELHDSIYGRDDHSSFFPLIELLRDNEIAPVAEIPLNEATLLHVFQSLEKLLDAGVYNINFFAVAAPDDFSKERRGGALASSAMPQTADIIEELANEMDVRFVWQPPMLREPSMTMSQQLLMGARCSDDYSIRLEVDGDVIPPRGAYQSAGNLLIDDWQEIWRNEAFTKYRQRIEKPTRCDDCPGLAICAADCPRKAAGWSQGYGG